MDSAEGEKVAEGEDDWKKDLKAPKKDDRVQTEVRGQGTPPRTQGYSLSSMNLINLFLLLCGDYTVSCPK